MESCWGIAKSKQRLSNKIATESKMSPCPSGVGHLYKTSDLGGKPRKMTPWDCNVAFLRERIEFTFEIALNSGNRTQVDSSGRQSKYSPIPAGNCDIINWKKNDLDWTCIILPVNYSSSLYRKSNARQSTWLAMFSSAHTAQTQHTADPHRGRNIEVYE